MNDIKNTYSLFSLVLFLFVVFFGCGNDNLKTNVLNSGVVGLNSIKPNIEPDEPYIEFVDSTHFQKVKQYIQKIGNHDRISISAILGDTSMMIDYYSIKKEGWKITKDNHTRLYFSYNNYSYGNVFLVQDSVHVEPYYTGPKNDIDTLNEIVLPITKLYNTLVNEAREE